MTGAVASAGISDFTPHAARRTFASLVYLKTGGDRLKLAQQLGHTDARYTERV